VDTLLDKTCKVKDLLKYNNIGIWWVRIGSFNIRFEAGLGMTVYYHGVGKDVVL